MEWWRCLSRDRRDRRASSPGLLGIGGGALIVPMLVFVFTAQELAARAPAARRARHLDGDDRVHVALQHARASRARRGGLADRARDRPRHARGLVRRGAARRPDPDAAARDDVHRARVLRRYPAVVRPQAEDHARSCPGRRDCSSPARSSAAFPAWRPRAARSWRSRSSPGATCRCAAPSAPRRRPAFRSRSPEAPATWSKAGMRPDCRQRASATSTCRRSVWWSS